MMCNIQDFGARKDPLSNDTDAIQAGIDACHKAGGGTVIFPPGEYMCGTIRLRSNVRLQLNVGATLKASEKAEHYDLARSDPQNFDTQLLGHLLTADGAEHISIVGGGRIYGNGEADYHWRDPEKPEYRIGLLRFQDCHHVTIRDIEILYSDAWTLHLERCDTVFINGVNILNNVNRLNSDGIDPDSCKNVHISNCHIVAGDDCIVLKTEKPYPCENVVVSNCTLETACTAIKLGTGSQGDFRDVLVSNCTICNSAIGVGFYMKDGAMMERITFSDLLIETLSHEDSWHEVFPIFMDIEKRYPDSEIGCIRDVTFRDVFIDSGSGILIQGMPESPIENLSLHNLSMRVTRTFDFAGRVKAIGGVRTTSDERDTRFAVLPSYVTLAYVRGLIIEDLRVFVEKEVHLDFERSVVYGHQIDKGTLRDIYRDPPFEDGEIPIIDLSDSQRVHVKPSR